MKKLNKTKENILNTRISIDIEKHTFIKESQIDEIEKTLTGFNYIKFINCVFINIDFSIFTMVANEFINCKFKDCGTFEEFKENNSFENCLWGKF